MFNVTIRNEGDSFLGSLEVDSYFFEPEKYDYAFYLYKNDEVVERIRYSEQMIANFTVYPKFGEYFVRGFIRDKRDKNKRGFNSKKIIIHNNV